MKSIIIVCILASSSLFAQPVINPLMMGRDVGGNRLLRLKPNVGEVFHYRLSTNSQLSVKSGYDVLTDLLPGLNSNDKTGYAIVSYITISVRSKRADAATDFQVRIDSIHYTIDNNGVRQSFTSMRAEDRRDSLFSDDAVLAGYDFGAIYDSEGTEKDIYGFYNAVDEIYFGLIDSLQTSDETSILTNEIYSSLKKIFRNLFSYLPIDPVAKDSASSSQTTEDYPVWGTLTFPMHNDFKQSLLRFEDQGGKAYAVFSGETDMTPTERILDDTDYHTTLPDFNYTNKEIQYIDVANGMLAYNKRTEEKSYAMKIESKLPEKSDKSFATVQRSKVETVVELFR
jgi:hypothetical protein